VDIYSVQLCVRIWIFAERDLKSICAIRCFSVDRPMGRGQVRGAISIRLTITNFCLLYLGFHF